MLEISQELEDAINDDAQNVLPVVVAEFADNRHIEDLIVTSSSDFFETQVLSKSPKLYWRFSETKRDSNFVADHSGNGWNGTIDGTFDLNESAIQYVEKHNTIIDTFIRGDSLGSLSPVSSDLNKSYITYGDAIWGIDSNEAYVAYNSTSFSNLQKVAVLESYGSNGYIEFEVGGTPEGAYGCVFRLLDEDNYLTFGYSVGTGTTFVRETIAGVNQAALVSTVSSITAGDVVRVSFIERDIIVEKNGNTLHSISMPNDFFENGTKHGFFYTGNSANPTCRWKNLEINTYNAVDYAINTSACSVFNEDISAADISFNDDFCIGFWVKTVDMHNYNNILSVYRALTSDVIIYQDGNVIKMQVYDVDNNMFEVGTHAHAINNEWHFVAFNKNDESIKSYIDGEFCNENVFNSIVLTSDYTGISLSSIDATPAGLFPGDLDEIFIFQRELSDEEIAGLYYSGVNDGTFYYSDAYFKAEQALNGIEGECLSWAVTDASAYGEGCANAEFYVSGDDYSPTKEYGWWTRSKSDSNGDFVNKEILYANFAPHKMTKVRLTTGYLTGKVNDFIFSYRVDGEDTFIDVPHSFSSLREVEIPISEEAIDINCIKLEILSTDSPLDFGRIYECNLIYEVDISDDVVNINFSKVRDNYESTLPLGNTAANSGSVTLFNDHRVYNYHGESNYAPYIVEDTKLSISLKWMDEEKNEIGRMPLGVVYVDSWNVDSSGMTCTPQFRDWSKFLQEDVESSGLFEEAKTAGKVIADIVKGNGFPAAKVSYYDSYYNEVLKDRPVRFFLMNPGPFNIEKDISSMELLDRYTSPPTAPALLQQDIERISIVDREVPSDIVQPRVITNAEQRSLSTYFDGTSGSTFCEFSISDVDMTNNFSLEAIIKPEELDVDGYYGIIHARLATGPADVNYIFSYNRVDASNYTLRFQVNFGGTPSIITTSNISATTLLNNVHHVIATRVGTSMKVYLNGLEVATGTCPSGSCDGNLGLYSYLGGTNMTFGGTSRFQGYMQYASVYNKGFSEDDAERKYRASQLSNVYVFPYLYSLDKTKWDAMLKFATADVGMFYFDEENYFRYEFLNQFHEPELARHREVQFEFSDELNIKDGSYTSELQTNKIKIEVSPVTVPSEFQNIWGAEDGDSLAIAKIDADMTPSQTSIAASNLDDPIWLSNGYFKIDNEIMSYASRDATTLSGIVRGLYGTKPEFHANNSLCREVRVYNIEYNDVPVGGVKSPFITAVSFDKTVDLEKFSTTPFKAEVILSANESNSVGDLAILQGTNPVTDLDNFYAIAGLPLTPKTKNNESQQTEIYNISFRRRMKRVKELVIQNEFIQNKEYAKKIMNFIILYFGDGVPIVNLDIIGVPQLQLGDLIKILKFDKLSIIDKNYWVIESTIDYDGGINQTLVLREYKEGQ